MSSRRRALSIEHLGPEVCRQLPDDLPRSVGEVVLRNDLYSTGESPTLKFPQVFEWLRDNPIHPSAELIAELDRVNYTILVGLSGGGRNSHIEEICRLYPDLYSQSRSVTTRPFRLDPKTGTWEHQGSSYFHESPEHVIEEILSGRFFEWEIIHGQQVSGTHIRSLEGIPDGSTAINETEPVGSRTLFEHTGKPSIFLLPEPYDAWIGNRIAGLPLEEQKRRLTTAMRNIKVGLDNPYYAFFVKRIVPDEEHEKAMSESAIKLHSLIQTLREGGIDLYGLNYQDEDIRARIIAEEYVERISSFLVNA